MKPSSEKNGVKMSASNLAAADHDADHRLLSVVDHDLSLAETVDARVVRIRPQQRSKGQPAAGEALAVDRAHEAIDLVAAASTGGGNRRGDHDHRHVLDFLELFEAALLAVAHDSHRLGNRPHRRRIVRLAGAVEAHDQAQSAEHVLFLTLEAADVFELRAGVGRLDGDHEAARDGHDQNPTQRVREFVA